MRVVFVPVENEDGTFCETQAESVPRVGEWVTLTRNDLNGVPSTNPEACNVYVVVRVMWATPGVCRPEPKMANGPVYPIVYVALDDPSFAVTHGSYDGYAALCGAAHVLANSINAGMDPEDVSSMEPGDVRVIPDGMFRYITIWKMTKNGLVEYSMKPTDAEILARKWWAESKRGTISEPSVKLRCEELFAAAKRRKATCST